jgi:hypothetical protein
MKQLFLTLTLACAAFAASAQTGNLPGVPIFSTPTPTPTTFNYYGTTNPNSNVVAGFGSRYLEYSGGSFTEFVKTNSSGNTGWTQISTGGGSGSFSGPLSSVSGNLLSFNGTGGNQGQDSGIAASSVTTMGNVMVWTNGGFFVGNATGFTFQGTNGFYISSNAITRVCVVVDTNRVTTWLSNTLVLATLDPSHGSINIGNGVGGRGTLTATTGAFTTLTTNASTPLNFSCNVGITGELEIGGLATFDSPATFGDTATFQQDVVVGGGISGDGSGLINLNPAHFNPPLLGTTNLVAGQYAGLDSKTNIYSTRDGGNWTNLVTWAHEGTATNLTASFNGTLQSFTVTNGSCSYRITTNSALVFDWQPKWLAGSNSVVTNGILSLTSYGGTNITQLEASIRENQ